ncbi:MAG: DUF433 domain-containing protein [Anaerolineae bacterium]|nr:DUF433 domain-containing protein [Anaerolineae bacterium]
MRDLDRITFDPRIMGGRACIRGMRITVALVLNLLANGMTPLEIVQEYTPLELEDVYQALGFGARLANDRVEIVELEPA